MKVRVAKKKPELLAEAGDMVVFNDGTVGIVCYLYNKYCVVNFENGEMEFNFGSRENMQKQIQDKKWQVYSNDMYALEIVPR